MWPSTLVELSTSALLIGRTVATNHGAPYPDAAQYVIATGLSLLLVAVILVPLLDVSWRISGTVVRRRRMFLRQRVDLARLTMLRARVIQIQFGILVATLEDDAGGRLRFSALDLLRPDVTEQLAWRLRALDQTDRVHASAAARRAVGL